MNSEKIIQAINYIINLYSEVDDDELKASLSDTVEKLRLQLYRKYLRGELCS